MYDYRMFYILFGQKSSLFAFVKILVSFTARFLGSCFYLIYPSKIEKSLSTKELISTFPLTNCITFMSFSNAKIIYAMIKSFDAIVNKMSLDRALCS